jgi:hypothetical protein
MGLIKVIFILIVVWYVMKLIVRYLIPKAILHFINKQQNFGKTKNNRKSSKEGEIKIKVEHPEQNKKDEGNFGEYVDFEEVEPEQKPEDE